MEKSGQMESNHSNNPTNPVTSNTLFYSGSDVTSSRVLYTPSQFARSSLLYLQETGHLTALKPHVSGRDHLSSYLMFVVKEGSGWLEYPAAPGESGCDGHKGERYELCDGHKGERYELCKGDMCFIDCRKGYSQSSSDDPWTISWVHFNAVSMPAIYNKYCERGGKPVFHPDNPEPFIQLLDSLYTTASSESYIRDVEINVLLSELVGELFAETVYEDNDAATGREKPVANAGDVEKIDVGAIKSYIDTHYQEPLSLETLSTHFHFNKSYVSRIFKEVFGVTVNGYIQFVRVSKAKELLRFSSMTIEEISHETGYGEDSNYFSRAFKKVEGVPPSVYRRDWVNKSVDMTKSVDKEK